MSCFHVNGLLCAPSSPKRNDPHFIFMKVKENHQVVTSEKLIDAHILYIQYIYLKKTAFIVKFVAN